MGRKLGGGCDPLGRGAGSPSNTMWSGPRPSCAPSFIFIRPTVWPQCTNVTDWADRQIDRTDRQRTDSIGRTVLQTVAPKMIPIPRESRGIPRDFTAPTPTLILINPAVWLQQTWTENWELLCPFLGGRRTGYPSNTMWAGPRPNSVPCGILTYPAVWPQYTNVTGQTITV